MVDPKVCKRCSAPITPGHAFCPRCGAALDVTEPATGPSEAADAAGPASEAESAPPKPASEAADAAGPASEAESAPPKPASEAADAAGPASEAADAAEPSSEAADAAGPSSEAESAPPKPSSEAADAAGPASEAESAPPKPASEAADAAGPASEAESAPPEPASEAADAAEPASEAADAAEPQDPQLGAFGVAPSQTDSPAARLAAAAASRTSSQVHVPVGWPVDVDEMQRSAARDASTRAAAAAREAAARAAAEKVAAVNAALDMEAEMDPEDGADSAPEPVAQEGARTSDRILTPSATNRTLGSIGAGRPAGALAAPTLTRAAALAQGPRPGLTPTPNAPAVAGRSGAFVARRMPPALPVVPLTTSDRIKATLASIAAEPKAELAATGLTALGGALALVSFALPWAGDNGLGVGTRDIHPRPEAWAFDTAAGWPLFLMAAVLLAAILASDKLEGLLPALAPTIRRLTESAIPMLLGGILLGVGLLYLTLPWGCGGGISLLVTGAVLLIAGSIVGLFFPAAERRD
jgi:hypothetical protein